LESAQSHPVLAGNRNYGFIFKKYVLQMGCGTLSKHVIENHSTLSSQDLEKASSTGRLLEYKTSTPSETTPYNFVSWSIEVMSSLNDKGSKFVVNELTLRSSTEAVNQTPLLKFLKDKRNSCKQNVIDSLYGIMSKQIQYGTTVGYPVNNENLYDVAIDFVAPGCSTEKQRFTYFSHREILLHRSPFFKGELSKDYGAVESMKRTLSSAQDLRRSLQKAENGLAERRNTAGEITPLKRTSSTSGQESRTQTSGVRNSLPPMKRNFTASSKNLLEGMDPTKQSSNSESSRQGLNLPSTPKEEEELFSTHGSLTSLVLTEDSKKRGQRKPNNQNLSVSLSKQNKTNLVPNFRIEIPISPLVKNPEILILIFENIYSGYFRPDYVHRMKSLSVEGLIQVLALGYQFKIHSIRSVAKSLLAQHICTHEGSYVTLEDMIEKTCKNITVDDIQKNNMNMVLELKKIYIDAKSKFNIPWFNDLIL